MVFYFNILNNKLLPQNVLNLSKSNAISIKKLGSSIFMFEIRNFHRTINNFDDKSSKNNNNNNINNNDNSKPINVKSNKNKLNKLNKLAKMSFISMDDNKMLTEKKIEQTKFSSKITLEKTSNTNQKENNELGLKTKEIRPNMQQPLRQPTIQSQIKTDQKLNQTESKPKPSYSTNEIKPQSTVLNKDSSYKLARLIDSMNPEKTAQILMDLSGKLSKNKMSEESSSQEKSFSLKKLQEIKANIAKKSEQKEKPIDNDINLK